MHVRQLALMNFRNYVRLVLDLEPGTTILSGDNGQGKTNVLEAVYYLATTRSFRAATEREMLHWRAAEEGLPFARLEARVRRDDGEVHLEVLLRGEVEAANDAETTLSISKTIKANGLPIRAAELVGQLNAVAFSPEDLALVSGPPLGRRRYLDITCSQVNRHYLRNLQRYHRVLVQRNHLLRQVRERRQPREALDVWNEELIALGSAIVAERLRMLDRMNGELNELYRDLSRTERLLEVRYQATSRPERVPLSEDESHTTYRARLIEVQNREVEQGVTLIGPHRDDFGFLIDGIDMSLYGSRGEQRLVVVALKLAEAAFMKAEAGEAPVLLLDDVLSELDSTRRRFVQEQISGEYQTLITVADPATCGESFLAGARCYSVERGALDAVKSEE